MMGAIIWMIIITAVIYSNIKKAPKKGTKPNQPQKPKKPRKPDNSWMQEYLDKPKQKTTEPEIVTRAKANSAKYANEDVTLSELESDHQHSERVSPAGAKHDNMQETKKAHVSPEEFKEPPEEESLLGSVSDLMVKGYDGNLSFERDFIGEAMDMISSFTL